MSFESSYELIPLGVLTQFINGDRGENYPKPTDYVDRGVPFISATDVDGGYISWEQSKQITSDAFTKLRGGKVQRGDILFCLRGSLGKLGYVEKEVEGAIASSLVILRSESLGLSRYLRFVLSNAQAQEAIKSLDNGSVQGNISASALKGLQVPNPPEPARVAITAVLDSLEARIALNRRINQTLEAMAQAIFKSWFVDFDPVKAKIAAKQEGRDPLRAALSAISGKRDAELDTLPPAQYDPLAATASLFPEEMDQSELGEIPKGWSAKKFGDFIDRMSVGKKFDQKTAFAEGAVPILDQGKSGIIGFHNEPPGVCASLEKPVVVFANHTCYMRLITFDFSAIQNVLPFVGKGVDTVWAYYATKDTVKFSEYKGHWPDFVLADAVVPQSDLTVHFRKILQPLISQMRIIELESEKLALLRDTLLPKLLSGELSVENIPPVSEATP
jgi:type I restriction enzyme S subunit